MDLICNAIALVVTLFIYIYTMYIYECNWHFCVVQLALKVNKN